MARLRDRNCPCWKAPKLARPPRSRSRRSILFRSTSCAILIPRIANCARQGRSSGLKSTEFYAVARYAEVRAILLDPATYCSRRGVGLTDFARDKPWRPPSLVLERDPPEHYCARAVLNRALSATVMKGLRARFVDAAQTLAAELARKGRFDAISDCAEVYPMMVFPDAVGLEEGRDHLLPYAATAFNMFGPDNELRRKAVAEMAPYVDWITAQCRREALTDDGIGAMVHAAADAGEVTPQEAELLVRSLLTAGFDTTVHGAGAAMRSLARNPDQFQALRADPTKARAAFEEAVRLEAPVQTFFRTTTSDTTLGGAAIPEGAKVLTMFAAQSRSAQMARARSLRHRSLDCGTCGFRRRRPYVRRAIAGASRRRGAACSDRRRLRLAGTRRRRRAAAQQHAEGLGAPAGKSDGGLDGDEIDPPVHQPRRISPAGPHASWPSLR